MAYFYMMYIICLVWIININMIYIYIHIYVYIDTYICTVLYV